MAHQSHNDRKIHVWLGCLTFFSSKFVAAGGSYLTHGVFYFERNL